MEKVTSSMPEAPRLLLGERQAVGARVEVDVREPRLDVLAHLDGPLVQEGLAVVEEVHAAQRRARLVDDAREQVEIEHPGLTRPRDPGLGRAAGLVARDVAGGRALDVEPAGQRAHVQIARRRRLVLLQRQLQRAVAAELRSAVDDVAPQRRGDLSCPHPGDGRRARVAEDAPAVRVGTPAGEPAVTEQDHRGPGPRAREAGRQIIEGHVRLRVTSYEYRERMSPAH
jgi:hypothetical protein